MTGALLFFSTLLLIAYCLTCFESSPTISHSILIFLIEISLKNRLGHIKKIRINSFDLICRYSRHANIIFDHQL